MSENEAKRAFTYGQGPTLHDWDVKHSNGQYDYTEVPIRENLNRISISTDVLNWFEKADRDPNTLQGVINIFAMTGLIGHEGAHWDILLKVLKKR